MSEVSVGVRELKSRLSEYLRRVKAGQTVVITEHGQPVGRIVPAAQPLEARLQAMAQAGLLLWSGKKLQPMLPVARGRGDRTVADLLVEDRE
jgi:prevent-host-death family protein